jgi:Zn finger protein HypA/HybF involved in hydrogenase expression
MTAELKAYCVHCGGGMEFPAELQGQKIVCPHCNVLTTLGQPAATPPPLPQSFHPALHQKAEIKSKSEFIGVGCFVQLVGLVLLFLFPIGTIAGVLLLILGGRMAIKLVCSSCGNPVSGKQVKVCPSCQSAFSK